MPTGVIKKKLNEKGCGFIAVQGSKDVFFHMSACNGQFDALQEGQQVSFDQEMTDRGPRATNVSATDQSDTRMAA